MATDVCALAVTSKMTVYGGASAHQGNGLYLQTAAECAIWTEHYFQNCQPHMKEASKNSDFRQSQ